MAALAQNLPRSSNWLAWFGDFLKHELTPYGGRTQLVIRMVVASTLAMIVCMTFRIPNAFYASLYALTMSRESFQATARSAATLAAAATLSAVWVIVGAMATLDSPLLRFLWVIGTLFLAFYAVSVIKNYAAAALFGFATLFSIPVLDSPIPVEARIESCLWVVGAILIGGVITLLTEAAFAWRGRADTFTEGIHHRLAAVEELLTCYADGCEVPSAARSEIERVAMVGTSRLRRLLTRAPYTREQKERMGALLALTGMLVDLGANLADSAIPVAADEQPRVRALVQEVAAIRDAISNQSIPRTSQLHWDEPPHHPLQGQIERVVLLIHAVLAGTQSPAAFGPAPTENRERVTLLAADALSNPEHIKFAIRGCLAAGLCYIAYNALFWPGVAVTSMTTCVLTAVSTIGVSHQRQFVRFAGVFIGGGLLGMGSQLFILPSIDSIGAFTVLFAAVTAIAAWFATASARISFLGIQIAFGFYVIHLLEFRFQTSLAIARDRVVGVVLALAMMWLTFDLFWSTPAGVAMKKTFSSSIRLLAQLAREPVSDDTAAAIERTDALRERINDQSDNVRSLADGVLFEFGPSRQQDLALRKCIREWGPQLRTLFLMRVASLKYRLQLPGFELPEAVRLWHRAYDDRSAKMLDEMADRIEGKAAQSDLIRADSPNLTTQSAVAHLAHEPFTTQINSFMTLLRGIDALTTTMAEEIANESRLAID
jgi:multidrug resistance protein MdtO